MNAAVTAWLHAGLPLKMTTLAITCAVDGQGNLMADPLQSEWHSCKYIATLALRVSDHCVVGVWPESGSGVSLAEAENLAELAKNCISLLSVVLRETLSQYLVGLRDVAVTNNELDE